MPNQAHVTRLERSWKPGQPLRLVAPRIVLASPPPPDCAALVASWFEDPAVGRHLAQPLTTVRDAQRAIERCDNRTVFFFGLHDRSDGALFGYIRAHVDPHHRNARSTTVVGDQKLWGGGYAVEARTAVNDFLFGIYALRKIQSFVYGRNAAAIHINKKLGYKHEGTLRQQERAADGSFRDVLCFGLLREEWLSIRGVQEPNDE